MQTCRRPADAASALKKGAARGDVQTAETFGAFEEIANFLRAGLTGLTSLRGSSDYARQVLVNDTPDPTRAPSTEADVRQELDDNAAKAAKAGGEQLKKFATAITGWKP